MINHGSICSVTTKKNGYVVINMENKYAYL